MSQDKIQYAGNPPVDPPAVQLLAAAVNHMRDRARTYDSPMGERSMAKTVAAFNALTGHALTEEQGWLFMGVLKMARTQQGAFRSDNYEDLAAYAALQGECAAATRTAALTGKGFVTDPRDLTLPCVG